MNDDDDAPEDSVARAEAVTARAARAFQQEDLALARRLNEEACGIYLRLGEHGKAAAAQVRTGQIARAVDGPDAALPYVREAVALAGRTGDLRTIASMQCRLVRLLGDTGATAEAVALARDTYVPTAEQLGDPRVLAYAHTDLAQLLTKSGDARGALALLPACRTFFHAGGDLPAEALALRSMAEAHLALHEDAELTAVLIDDLMPVVARIHDAGFTEMTMVWVTGLLVQLAARSTDVSAIIDEIKRRMVP